MIASYSSVVMSYMLPSIYSMAPFVNPVQTSSPTRRYAVGLSEFLHHDFLSSISSWNTSFLFLEYMRQKVHGRLVFAQSVHLHDFVHMSQYKCKNLGCSREGTVEIDSLPNIDGTIEYFHNTPSYYSLHVMTWKCHAGYNIGQLLKIFHLVLHVKSLAHRGQNQLVAPSE